MRNLYNMYNGAWLSLNHKKAQLAFIQLIVNQCCKQGSVLWILIIVHWPYRWNGGCHQFNANRTPAWDATKEETLFRRTLCKLGKHRLWRKPIVFSPKTKGRPTYIEKVPTLVPNWFIFMQMKDPNLHSFIGPNFTVLIGQNGLFWLVSKDADKDKAVQLQLDGAGFSSLVQIWFHKLLYKRLFRLQECSTGGLASQFVAFPWNAACMRGPL